MASRPAPQSVLPTAATPSAATADGWTEHSSPTGIPYYYNSITGVSTYDRPSCLPAVATIDKSKQTTVVATDKAAATRTWTAYTDASSGKMYYSDGVTTTWTCPPELADSEDGKANGNKRGTSGDNDASQRKPKRKKVSDNEETPYASKAEAVAAFKGLLLAKDISPTTKWNDVVRICSDDFRWEACTTVGERKQCLAEYQTKRANELRDVKRQEKARAKEAYQRLLTDVLPKVVGFAPGASRFMDVRDSLSKDDRFYAVEDETTREELFYDFVEELRKREERSKRNKKRETKEYFVSFLKTFEDQGKLTFASTWSTFISSLDESQKKDSKFTVSANMSDSDRQLFFADFITELQIAEDEKQRRIFDAERRAEKAQRDAYRQLLRDMAKAGALIPSTRWRGVEHKILSDPIVAPVQAQGREFPREIFEEFIGEWSDVYRDDRAVLNRVLKTPGKEFRFDDSTTIDSFTSMLMDSASPSPELYGEIRRILNSKHMTTSAQLLFDELRAEHEARSDGNKRGNLLNGEESSEDEGEIIEDEEGEEPQQP